MKCPIILQIWHKSYIYNHLTNQLINQSTISGIESKYPISGRRNRVLAKIVTFLISHHPDGQVGVDIIEPGLKGIRIGGMAKQSGGNNRTAGCIMPAIGTVGIRHAAGYLSVPGKIGTILSERSPEADIIRRIHPGV